MRLISKQHRFAIVGLAFAAYTCWVIADTCLKIAGASALPAYEVIALVGLATMVVLLLYALWHRNFSVMSAGAKLGHSAPLERRSAAE